LSRSIEPFAQHKFFPFLSSRKVAQAHTGKTKLRSQASWIQEGTRKMEAQKMENPREESQTRPQETHGITKQTMEKIEERKEAIQRIMPSAETSNPGRVGE
jgi:hypothetical protein